MSSQREELIEKLNIMLRNNLSDFRIEELADFILADRARICEPLFKVRYFDPGQGRSLLEAINETLKLAGVDNEKS